MPQEGQWERANTPLYKLSARERKVGLGILAVTVVAILAILVLTVGDSRPGPEAGCLRVNVPGKTGGETLHPCGAEAEALCARAANFDTVRSNRIVAACKEQGIEF
jgi:hypothetical protein